MIFADKDNDFGPKMFADLRTLSESVGAWHHFQSLDNYPGDLQFPKITGGDDWSGMSN